MKRLGTLLAGVALIVASGVFVSAQADDDRESMSLFTAAIHGTAFHCSAVNLSPQIAVDSHLDNRRGRKCSLARSCAQPKNAPGCECVKRYRTCTDDRSVLQGSGIGHRRSQ
jgi:hypothetical protein